MGFITSKTVRISPDGSVVYFHEFSIWWLLPFFLERETKDVKNELTNQYHFLLIFSKNRDMVKFLTAKHGSRNFRNVLFTV